MPQAEGRYLARGVIIARWSRGSFSVMALGGLGVIFPSGSALRQTV